jgi:DNA-binding MarR family transcriptional regulator
MPARESSGAGPADFGILLALAYGAFVDQLRAALAAAGFDHLNRSFGYVARALAAEPLSLRELAGRLDMTSQGALKIVDDMAANGYLERSPDPADRRGVRLRLTARGERALAAARAFHRRFEARLGRRLGARKVAALRAALTSLVEQGERAGAAAALRPL